MMIERIDQRSRTELELVLGELAWVIDLVLKEFLNYRHVDRILCMHADMKLFACTKLIKWMNCFACNELESPNATSRGWLLLPLDNFGLHDGEESARSESGSPTLDSTTGRGEHGRKVARR